MKFNDKRLAALLSVTAGLWCADGAYAGIITQAETFSVSTSTLRTSTDSERGKSIGFDGTTTSTFDMFDDLGGTLSLISVEFRLTSSFDYLADITMTTKFGLMQNLLLPSVSIMSNLLVDTYSDDFRRCGEFRSEVNFTCTNTLGEVNVDFSHSSFATSVSPFIGPGTFGVDFFSQSLASFGAGGDPASGSISNMSDNWAGTFEVLYSFEAPALEAHGVPEPSVFGLLGVGFMSLGMLGYGRRRRPVVTTQPL